MKTKVKSLWLAMLLMALAWPAAAHTVLSRPASGVIESLDSGTRAVRFTPTTGHAPRQLVVTRQTKFIHDWQFAVGGRSEARHEGGDLLPHAVLRKTVHHESRVEPRRLKEGET